jgi:hypothetical protein
VAAAASVSLETEAAGNVIIAMPRQNSTLPIQKIILDLSIELSLNVVFQISCLLKQQLK